MPSVVAAAFCVRLKEQLSEDQRSLVEAARGSASERREINRALMLGDRAVREWAGTAIAHGRPGAPNRFEELRPVSKPEDAYHDVEPAARAEHDAAASPEERAVAEAVVELAQALRDVDTESDVAGNRAAFELVGAAAAEVLARSAELLGGEEFAVEQGNRVLRDLVDLGGWTNQLGPRFD
jgi:hypothetical protein